MVIPKRKDGMPRSMTQKKRERKRGQPCLKKKETGMIRERKDITLRSKPYSSIHPSTHTLAPFDRHYMTCFSMDPLFDFTINNTSVPCSYPTLSSTKACSSREDQRQILPW